MFDLSLGGAAMGWGRYFLLGDLGQQMDLGGP
jgi:hypothetical protein